MKNNEYNIVNITNEKNNFSAEYTKAQKVEYSFQSENKNPIKDELNDNSTVNDKVEDNLSKKSKLKEEKKEQQEVENIESATSSSSSAASSNASSTAAASSSASAASASTASSIGGIVAAVSVTVASVGGAVGIAVVVQQEEKQDLITFVSSEITTNSVEFSFSMPARLLRYDEDVEVESDTPIPERNVVYQIKNSAGFDEEEYLVEAEEVDENTLLYYASIGGLSPDTSYALTISIKEEMPEVELPNYIELANRTFKTKAIGELITFDYLDASTNSVSFAFIVSNDVTGYDPESQITPAIQMSVSDGGQDYQEAWLESYEEYDENSIICYGDFNRLSAGTTYTLTISLSTETEFMTLGTRAFTTTAKPSSGFSFLGEINPTEDSVSQRFYVSGDYIGYDASDPDACVEKLIPAVTDPTGVEISGSVSLMTTSGSTVVFMATVTGLTGNTSYVLNIYFDNNGTREQLNDEGKQFTTSEVTPDVSFNDDATVVGPEYVQFGFYLKTKYIQRSEAQGETITNVYAKIEDGEGFEADVNITNVSDESSSKKSYCAGKFEELTPLTTYTISVYVTGEETITFSETLEVSTPASDSANFSYVTNSFKISCNTITFDFNISKSFLGFDPDDEEGKRTIMSNLYAEIDDNQHSTVRTTTVNLEVVSGDTLVGTASADGLISSNDAYVMNFYLFDTKYQMKTCISAEPYYFSTPGPGFRAATIDPEASFNSHQFEITLDFDDDSQNPQYDTLSIQLYSSNYDDPDKSYLGSPISLESVTTEQTIDLPYREDGGEIYYDFELEDIKSFEILLNQTEVVYHDDIAFINTDASVNQVNSDYLITVDRSSPDPEVILPLQIDYTDNYQTLSSFAITLEPTDGVSSSGWCSASATGEYQSITFSDSGLISYIDDGNTEFVLNVFDGSNQSTPLWSDTVNLSVATVNRVYGGSVYTTEISSEDTNLGIDLACVYGAQTPTGPQIVLINEADETEYYVYDFNFSTFIIVEMTSPSSASTGATITDFDSLSAAMSGKTFKIRIDYNDGTDSQQEVIQTGVSFTFTQGI